MKKLIYLLVLTIILSISISLPANASNSDFRGIIVLKPGSPIVNIGGENVRIQAPPYIENGTTMVPLRFICQNVLNASVQWDTATSVISIYDGTQTVIIDIKNKRIMANGVEYKPPVAPAIRTGHTYVPLRLIAELFNCTVNYDTVQRTVTISTSQQVKVLPVARFELPQGLIGGQELSYKDTSYDPMGHAITSRVWEITMPDGRTLKTNDPRSIMSRPSSGTYTFSLRVKNAFDVWSEPTIQTYTVLPNEPPVITDFASTKKEAAIGEAIDFSYNVINEEWEKITEVRWAYSWFDGENHKTAREKPRAFFRPGLHKVSVQVRDEYGNWSKEAEIDITVKEKVVMSEKAFKFNNPIQGELFLNHTRINYNLKPTAQVLAASNDDVTLIASNNPEKVDAAGILYHDEASGLVRVRYHHRNMLPGNLRILAIAENNTNTPVEVEFLRSGLAGPSLDIMQVGQQVVVSYLLAANKPSGEKIILQPGERIILNSNQRALKNDEVLAGLIEIHCSDKLHFTIAAMEEGRSLESYKDLPVLPKYNTHIRGTFGKAGINMDALISGKQTEKVVIGRADAYPGYFLYGFENTTGQYIINNGNRGVLHTITLTAEERVGVFLNPRGTIFRGALMGFNGDICLLANAGVLVGNQEGVILGVLEKGETKTITYLAPSGSDSPVLLIFVPESEW